MHTTYIETLYFKVFMAFHTRRTSKLRCSHSENILPADGKKMNVPAATKIAIILIGIGFIVFVVGFGAPYWTVYGIFGHGGLWQGCWNYHGTFRCFSSTGAHSPPPPTPFPSFKSYT